MVGWRGGAGEQWGQVPHKLQVVEAVYPHNKSSLDTSPSQEGGRVDLLQFALPTCSSHLTGTVGQQLSVKVSSIVCIVMYTLRECMHSIAIPMHTNNSSVASYG